MPADLHRRLLAAVQPPAGTPMRNLDPNAWLAALLAVIELHAPRVLSVEGGGLVCPHCYDDPRWPCATVRTIAQHLGIQQDPKTHREEEGKAP